MENTKLCLFKQFEIDKKGYDSQGLVREFEQFLSVEGEQIDTLDKCPVDHIDYFDKFIDANRQNLDKSVEVNRQIIDRFDEAHKPDENEDDDDEGDSDSDDTGYDEEDMEMSPTPAPSQCIALPQISIPNNSLTT